jgi:hypothetical protein
MASLSSKPTAAAWAAAAKRIYCNFDGKKPQVLLLDYGQRGRTRGVLEESNEYATALAHCRLVAD